MTEGYCKCRGCGAEWIGKGEILAAQVGNDGPVWIGLLCRTCKADWQAVLTRLYEEQIGQA